MALVCVMGLFGCAGDEGDTIYEVPTPTVGALNVNVSPGSATVVVAGPGSFTETFTGNRLLTDLVPGQYTATATAAGFVGATNAVNVVAGQTSSISLFLQASPPSVGALNVNATPASASVVVTGPSSFTRTFTGNQLLTALAPGQYTATATAPGFVDETVHINVDAGQTSTISLVLAATPLLSEAPAAVYRDGQGNLVPLVPSSLQSGKFVFYAWLQDVSLGIDTTKLTPTSVVDPGKPLAAEQAETAPSFTQNLASAWVGFTDSAGVVRPVIGADVRWEIDQYYSGRVNSMQFGTSDDNRVALGYGVFDDQADTRTNNARLEAERLPFIASEFPLYNQTGVGAPFVDGFTWVTLFSPDKLAAGRIVAVATVDGEEIGKQILYKKFAPTPKLEITKTVNTNIVNLVGGTASATWTVTVKNTGLGDATVVELTDILASGAGASYTLGSLPAGSTPVGDGFTHSFPLASGSTATFTAVATVTEPGTYCNEGQIVSYKHATTTWSPVDLKAQACFTALESNLSIIKDFVAANGTTSLGKTVTVEADVPARVRVRVINNGTGAATGIKVKDLLNLADPRTTGVLANYTLAGLSAGSTANANGGFDITIANLAAGATSPSVLFTVAASVDGVYCDTATIEATTSGAAIGIGSESACLTVATPKLTITKVNAPASVIPSATYTSTIVVNNSGTATARNVEIRDLLGLNSAANVRAIYVSSSLNGVGGTLAANVVTASTVDILAGASLTFTVVSRIPLGAASGTYCDTASVVSSNAASPPPVEVCVQVPAFSALQTQLIDLGDPIAVGKNITYFSTLYVEALSNEGVGQGRMTYSFGLTSPTGIGTAGVFQVISTRVYLDTMPIRDPVTGVVVSDTSNATAVLQTEGTHYTVNNTTPGLQVITMAPGVILQPNTARYLVHEVLVPSGTPTNHLYTTNYIWESVGLVNPLNIYAASSSEPTTVLP